MGGASKEQSSNRSQSYTSEQNEWLKKALALYGPELGQNENVYQGDRVADFADLQRNVLGNAGNFMNIFSTPQSTGTPLFNETGQSITGLLSGNTGAQKITGQQAESYFTDKIKDPTMRMLKEDILPTVNEGYAGGDFFGSARGKARDAVTTDVANSLTQQKADLNWNVLQNNQAIDESKANRTLSTLGSAMQYGQMPAQETLNNLQIAASQVEGLNELFGFGQAEQTQQQQELTAAIAKFAEENQITDPNNLSILLSLLNMNYSTSNASSSGWKFNIAAPESSG